MKYKSNLIVQASGSLGGTTFTHSAGVQVMRNRSLPVNPNTPRQQTVRAAMSLLNGLWVETLTAGQRNGWATYAQNVPLTNVFGDPVYVSALCHYQRSNIARLQAALARVDDAPPVFDLGEYTEPVCTCSEAAQEVSVAYEDTDAWLDEDGSSMLLYVSEPQNDTINFFKGPYKYAGKIDGDAVAPPASPQVVAVPVPVVEGQRVFWQVRVTRADGRYSAICRGFLTVAA